MANGSTSSAQWRPLDSRFARLEGRLIHHRRWLEKETESQVQDFAVVEQRRRKYLRSIHHQDIIRNSIGELQEHRVAKRIKRVETVCNWISNGSQIQHAAANASVTEHLGSCNWFFELKKYRDWKEVGFDASRANDRSTLQDNWHEQVLFVQGM
jgi:hypothetical protein